MHLAGGHIGGRRAFTLIELTIVLTLVAIMTALIVPEMRGTHEDALLRATGRKIISACNLAWSRSISTRSTHRVRLDLQRGRYSIESLSREGATIAGYEPVPNVPDAEGELDTRVEIRVQRRAPASAEEQAANAAPRLDAEMPPADSGDFLTFFADGTADGRDIILKDREGFEMVLRINPATAQVRIAEKGRDAP